MALPMSSSSAIFKINAKDGFADIDGTHHKTLASIIVDLPNLEVGPVKQGKGSPPEFRTIPLTAIEAGSKMPSLPDERDAQGKPAWRRGFRVPVRLSDTDANGRPVREWGTGTWATYRGLDALHDQWMAERDQHPDQLPVVRLAGFVPLRTGFGDAQMPNLIITGWADRPADMPAPNGHDTEDAPPFDDSLDDL